MNNYNQMYKTFGITENNKSSFKTMAESEYSQDLRVAKVEITTHIFTKNSEVVKQEESIDAKLV